MPVLRAAPDRLRRRQGRAVGAGGAPQEGLPVSFRSNWITNVVKAIPL